MSSLLSSLERALEHLSGLGLLGLRLWLGQEFVMAGWRKLSGGLSAPEWFAGLNFGHRGKRKLTQALMKWINSTMPLSFKDNAGNKMSCLVDIRPSTDTLTLSRNVLIVMRNVVIHE